MNKDPKIFLEHMIESMDLIDSFTVDCTLEEFLECREKQDAVVRRLEIIGESARNIPKDFKDNHTGIEWKEIVGMRDKIVHEYFDVDLKIVWDTVKGDLLNVRRKIKKLLKEC